MLFGPRSKAQHRQNDSNNKQPTNVDELFDIEYFPPKADNYWEDQSQYDLGLFAVRHMDVVPASVSDRPTASSSSVSEPSDIEPLPREEEFVCYEDEAEDSTVQSLERTNHVKAAALSDILSLLKPETFNWADDVEYFGEQEKEDLESASIVFVLDSPVPSNPSDPTVAFKDRFDIEPPNEVNVFQDIDIVLDCASQYSSGLHGPDVSAMATAVQCQFTGEQLRLMYSQAIKEVTQQVDLVKNYPNIHHFNWLGDAVMERSHTTPEVSLFVIVSPPKPFFSERLMREAVTLRQAMKFVDPILYYGGLEDLALSGQELLKTITGQAFQFYTQAGTWQHDTPDTPDTPDTDIREPIVDRSSPLLYASEPWLPLNGWFDVHFASRCTRNVSLPCVRGAFTRQEYLDQANSLSERDTKRRRHQPSRRSRLQQCITADDVGDTPYNKLKESSVVERDAQHWADTDVHFKETARCDILLLEKESDGESTTDEDECCTYQPTNLHVASKPYLSDIKCRPPHRTRNFELNEVN
ncbi:hypothetical protein GX50_07447 [[Emmonsia] crescens]|uniref:Uncharacterized protein n=1 Tax=[Emmonsia] crescens TaxID=73230 RepID=A0A2B7Z9I2_9EURO|nr:hypothetical protein GX50_07447 [Emmonsia crescens]